MKWESVEPGWVVSYVDNWVFSVVQTKKNKWEWYMTHESKGEGESHSSGVCRTKNEAIRCCEQENSRNKI